MLLSVVYTPKRRGFSPIPLTKVQKRGYNNRDKSCEKKSRHAHTFQRASVGEKRCAEAAEHGLGAGVPIGRYARVRPLMRCEAGFSCKARWYREVITVALEA